MEQKKHTLDEIAIKTGSDKSSKGHGYCEIYERYLGELRNYPINLLELGYGGYEDPNAGGESARMWKEYFKGSEIIVTDIWPKKNVPRGIIFIETGQSNSIQTGRYSPYDVIVDDASHINLLTIQAFKSHWPLLKSGGLYFIEDLHASYHPYYRDSNPEPLKGNTTMTFLSRLLHEVNSDFMKPIYRLGYDIEFIHFYRELCVIKKK